MENEKLLSTAIYIRVSTEEQAREGFSINAQKEKLRQYALARDWNIFDFYIDDGISGKNIKDRPEINRMLNDIRDGKVDNVLVYKIDRLTRSTKNLIELVELFNERNCAFNSLMESIDTSSATGRMFIKIVGIFAEFERENLAERVSFGYEQKTREGNYTNANGVYGYDYIVGKGDLIVNEFESKIVRYIYGQYLHSKSMTAICKELISHNVPTKRGGKWSQSTIFSILTNPLYIGKIRYGVVNKKNNKFEVDGSQTPILDEETFYSVQEIMDNRQKYQKRRYPSENSIFLGALFCSECGAKMGTTQHKRVDILYVNYYCHNAKNGNCDCKIISQNRVENAFMDYISQIEIFEPEAREMYGQDTSQQQEMSGIINKEIEKTEKRQKEIRDLFLQDKISFGEYKEFINSLDEKIKQLKDDVHAIAEEETEFIDYESFKHIIGNIRENWAYLTNKEKCEFVHMFISRIDIYSHDKTLSVSECSFYSHIKHKTTV